MSRIRSIVAAMLAGAGLLSAGPAAWAGDTLAHIRETHTLTLAYRETPPFSFTDEHKHITGYAIELCQRLGDALKKELKMPDLKIAYVPVDSATRFSAIIENKADLECGSTTNNAERRKKVAFTIPHFFSGVRMVVKASSGIRNWPDLKGKTVVTTKSTTTIALIEARNDTRALGMKVVEAADDYASFALLEEGRADAFPMDDVLLYSLKAVAKNPATYAIVGEQLSVEPYSLMLRRDDPAFKRFVDQELSRMALDGETNRLYARWFMHPIDAKGTNLNMPMGRLLRDVLQYPSDKTAD